MFHLYHLLPPHTVPSQTDVLSVEEQSYNRIKPNSSFIQSAVLQEPRVLVPVHTVPFFQTYIYMRLSKRLAAGGKREDCDVSSFMFYGNAHPLPNNRSMLTSWRLVVTDVCQSNVHTLYLMKSNNLWAPEVLQSWTSDFLLLYVEVMASRLHMLCIWATIFSFTVKRENKCGSEKSQTTL